MSGPAVVASPPPLKFEMRLSPFRPLALDSFVRALNSIHRTASLFALPLSVTRSPGSLHDHPLSHSRPFEINNKASLFSLSTCSLARLSAVLASPWPWRATSSREQTSRKQHHQVKSRSQRSRMISRPRHPLPAFLPLVRSIFPAMAILSAEFPSLVPLTAPTQFPLHQDPFDRRRQSSSLPSIERLRST